MRSTSGCAVSAAPASSPMPCTTLNTPSGMPASCVMSASREAGSGAQSGGLKTTVLPAASAGARRQVPSISGAFHGVMTAATPAGSHETWLVWPRVSESSCASATSSSAKKWKLWPARGMTERCMERRSEPLSRVSTAASSRARFSMPSPTAWRTAARSFGDKAAQFGNASCAAATAASTSCAPPRATLAMVVSSMGETSANVSPDATRSPPIQCSVETSTSSTMVVSMATLAAAKRQSHAAPHHVVRYRRIYAARFLRSTALTGALARPVALTPLRGERTLAFSRRVEVRSEEEDGMIRSGMTRLVAAAAVMVVVAALVPAGPAAAAPTAPSPRYDAGMAYDAARGQVVLFGGQDASSFFGDTWTWDGAAWTLRTPAHSPPPMCCMGMAYDAARGQVVLFGGYDFAPIGDTWTWDGTDWT